MSSESAYKFKITLFGPGDCSKPLFWATRTVGKTSLLLRYIKDYFSDDLKKTIGSNFLIKDVDIEGKSTRLLLWDIGGQIT